MTCPLSLPLGIKLVVSGSFYVNELREKGSDLHISGWGGTARHSIWVGSVVVSIGGKTDPSSGMC